MSFYFVEPEVYEKYKDQILALSDSTQVNIHEQLPKEKRRTPLSDEQIAAKLGLDTRVVREIRCVAERDKYAIDEFEQATEFKANACADYAKRGMSAVMKKYVDRARRDKNS